jgi:hypothetical protein
MAERFRNPVLKYALATDLSPQAAGALQTRVKALSYRQSDSADGSCRLIADGWRRCPYEQLCIARSRAWDRSHERH